MRPPMLAGPILRQAIDLTHSAGKLVSAAALAGGWAGDQGRCRSSSPRPTAARHARRRRTRRLRNVIIVDPPSLKNGTGQVVWETPMRDSCSGWRGGTQLSAGAAGLLTPGLQHFGEGVFGNRDAECGNFLQAAPGARDALLLLGDECGIEKLLGEDAVATDRWKGWIDDVLGVGRVAADVPLAHGRQGQGRDLAEDVAEVEVGVGDDLDILTADVAEIALFAADHVEGFRMRLGVRCSGQEVSSPLPAGLAVGCGNCSNLTICSRPRMSKRDQAPDPAGSGKPTMASVRVTTTRSGWRMS